MEKFFAYRDRWGNGLALWVVLVMVFALPFVGMGIRKLRLENEVTNWLPEEDPDAQVLNWFHDQFEKESRMLVSWDSSALGDPRAEAFKNALMGVAPHREDRGDANEDNDAVVEGRPVAVMESLKIAGVESVTTPSDVIQRMLDNNIDEETAVDRLSGVLIGSGFLKIQLSEAGLQDVITSQKQVQDAAAQVVGREVALLPRVPTYELPELDGSEEDAPFTLPQHNFQLRWKEIAAQSPLANKVISTLNKLPSVEQAFFAPGAPIAVSVSLNQYGDDNLRETIDAVHAAALAVGIGADELRMGGAPIGRNRLNAEAQRATWNTDYPVWNLYKRSPIFLSTLVSVTISFVLLRSFRLAMLVVATSLFTAAIVLSLIPASGKTLNMVLIVLPNLLLVLTTSGAIHVANYWKHSAYTKEKNPIAHAVGMAAQPCLLASVTTAIGMASLMTAVLSPVREFGIFSAIGCIISLFMVLVGFPSLMSVWPARNADAAPETESEARFWGGMARKLIRYRAIVSVGCVSLFVFSVIGLQFFRTETKVIRYFPSHTRIIQDYDFLEEGLAGLVSIDTIVRFDSKADGMNVLERMEFVRLLEERIAEHRWVSGTLSLADFRPQVEAPDAGASLREKVMYGRRAQRTEQGIFEDEQSSTKQFARKVDTSLTIPHRKRQLSFNAGDEVWRIRAQTIVMGDVDYGVLTEELNAMAASTVNNKNGVDYVVTGLVPLFLRTQEAVLQSLIRSFGLAFAIIAVVMVALLKNPVSGFLAMLPNLFPIGVVFGIVSWIDMPVDIGTMITASVALGIAIDGTLHLLTWFQDGVRSGLSRNLAIEKALQHCGPAMWQTSASIALGILMLAGADLLLISRFGLLMASLVFMALIADVVLLPAMLAGWLGTLITKSLGADVRGTAESMNQEEGTDPEKSLISFPSQLG